MKSIKVGEDTYNRLVQLKHGMESISDVIDNLLKYREQYLQKMLEEDHARAALEADRAKDRKAV